MPAISFWGAERVLTTDPNPQPPPAPPYVATQQFGALLPAVAAGLPMLYGESVVTASGEFTGTRDAFVRWVYFDPTGAPISPTTTLGGDGVSSQFGRIGEIAGATLGPTHWVAAWIGVGSYSFNFFQDYSLQLGGISASGAVMNLSLGASGALTLGNLSVVDLGDETFAVVHTRTLQTGGGADVFAQIFRVGATTYDAVTAQFRVNTVEAGEQFGGDAVALGSNFLVVWRESDGTAKGKIFDAAGATVLADTTLIATAIPGAPVVTALTGGGFALAWAQGGEVYAQVFGANGVAVSAIVQVNDNTLNNQELPQITATIDGGFVVIYNDSSFAPPDTSSAALRARKFDAQGVAVGASVNIPTTLEGNHILHEISTLADGRIAIQWADNSSPITWRQQIIDDRGALLYGTAGIDTIYGADTGSPYQHNVIVLGDGADTAFALGGNDYVYGGAGIDTIRGGDGVDVLIGEGENDQLFGEGDTDYIYGGLGDDAMNGAGGVDVLLGEQGADTGYGGDGGDYFYMGDGADTAFGDAGNDIFVMEAGNDTATGGDGQDYFYMGDGNDTLNGEAGVDVMLGEAGDDIFNPGLGVDYVFMGTGSDRLNVDRLTSGVTVLNDFTPGDASADTIHLTNSFTSFAQVQAAISDFTASGGFCILTLDADTSIWFIGVTPAQLTAGDFVFGGV